MVRALVLVFSLTALTMSAAWAGNSDTIPMGDQAAVAAGAVVAAGDDCGSVAYNPAGLVGIPRNRVSIGASFFRVRLLNIPAFLRTETPDGPVAVPAAHSSFETVPPAVIVARRLGPRLAYGLSLTVPEASAVSTDRRNDPSPGTFELRQNARNIATSALYRAGATLAWAPTNRLRLGATFNLALSRTTSFFAFELSATEASGRRTFASSSSLQQGTVGAVGGILGAQWSISPRFATGLALEPPLLGILGSARTDQYVFFSRTTTGQPPTVTDNLTAASHNAAGDTLGHFVGRWGVAYTPAWGWVSAQVDYRPTSATNVRAGALYQLSPAFRIGGGGFTDFNTAAPTADVRFDFLGGTAGVLWRKAIALRDSSEPLFLSTTFAARYAYGWGRASTVSSNPATDDPTQFVTMSSAPGSAQEISLYIGSGVDY